MSNKVSRMILMFTIFMFTTLSCSTFDLSAESDDTLVEPTETLLYDAQDTPSPEDSIDQQEDSSKEAVPPFQEDGSMFWSNVIDERTGVRFVIPCFWTGNIPPPGQDPSGLGAFSVFNFTEEWVQSFGPKAQALAWEYGGLKIDVGYNEFRFWNLPPGSSLDELVAAQYPEDDEFASSELVSTEEVIVNGQEGLMLTVRGKEFGDIWSYYLFPLAPEYVFYFSSYPSEALQHPDIQGILHSIALTHDVKVQIPNHVPAAPLEGVDAQCLKGYYGSAGIGDLSGILQCPATQNPETMACSIQQALLLRDIPALSIMMADPFTIGYWQSEWRSLTTAEAANEFDQYHLPIDTRLMTFTSNRSQFPPLQGMPPDTMFGPEVNVDMIIYSEGWGSESQGAALLYIVQQGDGTYVWHGMLLSFEHFDK
jgi:hypothetical protein